MDRKSFFKTIFGGFVAASAASLAKAEETTQPPEDLALGKETLRIDEDGNFGINEDFDNVTISLYDNDNLNIRREAIREIINKVKNELTNRGIGMEMVNNIFVSASWRKPKAAEASTYIITYSYIVHVPCPPDFYTSGQSN